MARFPRCAFLLQRQFLVHDALEADCDTPCESFQPSPPAERGVAAGEVPARIGKYPVIARLAEGGQATVYRAVHPGLGREVVIKLGRGLLGDGPAEAQRILAEGRVLAQLEHPGLARVYDVDLDQGRPYLVMEYVRGRDLAQYARQERVGPREAASLVAQVARAAAVAHRRGVIHKDIKPKNVLLGEDGRPRLLDFGLAAWQHAWSGDGDSCGLVSGTVPFMAPEQALGQSERVNQRSE